MVQRGYYPVQPAPEAAIRAMAGLYNPVPEQPQATGLTM